MAGNGEFRLIQLLEHKRRQEEAKSLELATMAAEQARVRDALRRLKEQEDAQLRSLSESAQRGRLDPVRLDASLAYLRSIEGSIAEQLSHVAAVEERALASREELIGILREKQLLEQLEQRDAAASAAEQQRREGNQADETATQRYLRRLRGDGGDFAIDRAGEVA